MEKDKEEAKKESPEEEKKVKKVSPIIPKITIMDKLKETEHWPQIYEMIVQSVSHAQVARYIKDTLELLPDVSFDCLRITINRYYHKLPVGELNNHGSPSPLFHKTMQRIDNMADEMIGMWDLADKQMNRLKKSIDFEEQMGMTMDQTSRNVIIMMDIFTKINDMKSRNMGDEFKFNKSGREASGSARINHEEMIHERLRNRYGDAAQALVNPESRKRLINVIEKLDKLKRDEFKKILVDAGKEKKYNSRQFIVKGTDQGDSGDSHGQEKE